ncbi:MAG TPA: hypothetical protein VH743_19245 [Beijerinckiaceae bacterium]|jgi:hypothetical protein
MASDTSGGSAMSNFSDFVNAVVDGAGDLARTSFAGFVNQAQQDARALLTTSEDNIKTWAKELAAGDLREAEFKGLLQGEADLWQLAALTRTGIAAAELQRFRDRLVDLVFDSVFGKLLKV